MMLILTLDRIIAQNVIAIFYITHIRIYNAL